MSERDTVAPDGLGIPAVSVQSRPDRTLDPENTTLGHMHRVGISIPFRDKYRATPIRNGTLRRPPGADDVEQLCDILDELERTLVDVKQHLPPGPRERVEQVLFALAWAAREERKGDNQ